MSLNSWTEYQLKTSAVNPNKKTNHKSNNFVKPQQTIITNI